MHDYSWEEIEHTADLALRVRSTNLAGLFEGAARGMFALMTLTCQTNTTLLTRSVVLVSYDRDTLLVDWLTELLFIIQDRKLAPLDMEILKMSNEAIEARVIGGRPCYYEREIKAITYHELKIQQTEAGFETTIIFDV